MKTDVFADNLGAFCRETHVALASAASGPLAGLELIKQTIEVQPRTDTQ